MPVEDAVLDFDPLGEFEQDGRRMLRLILVAAQRAMVNTVVDVALAAKLEPVGVDLVPFAMARAVGMPEVGMEDEEGGEEAIVDIGATVTNILVHEKGVTRFVRILPSGGRDITLAIARNFGVEADVAERLKRGEAVEGGPDLDEVHRAAMQRAQNFVDEVRSSLEFYTAQTRDARIGRVLPRSNAATCSAAPSPNSPCRKRRLLKRSPCSRWPWVSASPEGISREPGQPSSP